MRLAVVGGRDFDDYDLMCDILNDYKDHGIDIIISGGAKGADSLAERYAVDNDIDIMVLEADWESHGRSAGPIRNQEIIEQSTDVVAFWNGKSRGTKHSIGLAKKKGCPCAVILY